MAGRLRILLLELRRRPLVMQLTLGAGEVLALQP